MSAILSRPQCVNKLLLVYTMARCLTETSHYQNQWWHSSLTPPDSFICISLQWRHNGCNSVSNHQSDDCLLKRLFRRRSKKTSRLRIAGLCVGNSPGTGEFPAQMASNMENVSIWRRHHVLASWSYMDMAIPKIILLDPCLIRKWLH